MRQHHHRSSRAAFGKGVGLVKYCNQKLTEVVKKVELVVKDKEGMLQLKPFEVVSDGDDDD
jgi:exonuclease VII small subunit